MAVTVAFAGQLCVGEPVAGDRRLVRVDQGAQPRPAMPGGLRGQRITCMLSGRHAGQAWGMGDVSNDIG
ncbi:hypothetical protein BBK14_20265 [Parafrankia soli]|uniref:Uncharacterized protein n=1 Tax=Parafrankia soli TaxID=2599596 RepID=A0A1S1Q1T8_9ACTN|nr:hypothetical protein BBK14_20265 [Parafrankia soli]